jgi:hypothetical protein
VVFDAHHSGFGARVVFSVHGPEQGARFALRAKLAHFLLHFGANGLLKPIASPKTHFSLPKTS